MQRSLTSQEVRALLTRVRAVRKTAAERDPREFLYWSAATSTWYAIRKAAADRYVVTTHASCGGCSSA